MAAGSAAAMIGANLRFGIGAPYNVTSNATKVFQCHPGGITEATVIFSLGALGMGANVILMALILAKRHLRRWSQGLLFHQAMVDCARAAILLPLGLSILNCQPVNKCSLVETAFLLLVTVSTVNMLTTVLNDSPVFPESEEEADLTAPLLMDSPQCVLFGTFMIWFASITINLGPTFLSGALAANTETGHNAPSCPLVHGPFRHYILNVLWIVINVICVLLTLFHLRKLHRDLTKANVEAVRVAGLVTTLVSVTGGHGGSNGLIDSNDRRNSRNGTTPKRGGAIEEHRRMRNYLRRMEREGVQRVKMFLIITAAYVIFWGPLFFVTLVHHPVIGNATGYEVTLHIAHVHAFINPALFLALHRGLRQGMSDVCCGCCESLARWILGSTVNSPIQSVQPPSYEPPLHLPSPPDPPLALSAANTCDLTDVALLKPPLPPVTKHLLMDDLIAAPPDPWILPPRPKSTTSLYQEEISRRPSLLLPRPPELGDLSPISPASSDLPSE
ncbi:uncharacterized protein [Neodiprion pinetum]|uniref:uncharacterized protein isoform X1 n=2 Tax=Neodiprion pinetum TaxID=441929 RepID=UPI001EDE2F58|nr:uncharacterized protein LOC124225018 isoform X1 [Neodiprion pinetum]XP_046493338.1 uncharacterized protein LOC124225018 isoform X1 [Neodiprion pinetum]XP_046493339.1 uncharacterized protein LOC124225018 isoform X1 [Neodiprion pinetum]